jgi:hypothetical protein
MLSKRGQVTLYVIVSIIIVGAALFFLILWPKIQELGMSDADATKILNEKVPQINGVIKNCIEPIIKNCSILVSIQGGYMHPAVGYNVGNYTLNYGCIKSTNPATNNLPLITKIGKEIVECSQTSDMKRKIDGCINNFNAFRNQIGIEAKDYTLSVGDIDTKGMNINVNYPITLKKAKASLMLSGVDFKIATALGRAYGTAVSIVNDECSTGNFDIDNYVRSNPGSFVTIERQVVGTNTFYYLQTIPLEQEETLNFHFVVG